MFWITTFFMLKWILVSRFPQKWEWIPKVNYSLRMGVLAKFRLNSANIPRYSCFWMYAICAIRSLGTKIQLLYFFYLMLKLKFVASVISWHTSMASCQSKQKTVLSKTNLITVLHAYYHGILIQVQRKIELWPQLNRFMPSIHWSW